MDAKLHPFTGSRNESYSVARESIEKMATSESYIGVIDTGKNFTDILPGYSAVICDVSSVVTECLITQKPIFLYWPDNDGLVMASSNMPFHAYCYTFATVDELEGKMQQVLAGDDPLAEARRKALHYFINVDATSNDRMAAEIQQCSPSIARTRKTG